MAITICVEGLLAASSGAVSTSTPKQLKWTGFFPEEHKIAARLHTNHPEYPAHDHEFVELVFVVSGSGLHETALGQRWLEPGSVFLFRPGAWHSFLQTDGLTLYNCCFDSVILGRELGWMIDDPQLGRLLWGIPLSSTQHGLVALTLPTEAMLNCEQLLKELCDLTHGTQSVRRMQALGRLMMLLEIVAAHLPDDAGSRGRHSNPAISAVLKLIDAHPEYDWTLEALAERTNMAPNYLVRLFTKTAGLPPMAYLRRRRLELATRLLIHSDLLVGDVGNSVGWPDANYFTRRFRAEFGVTPTCYRARHRARDQA